MRILTRYILHEVVSHAAIGAAIFTFVLFTKDLGRILELVVRNSAPLSSVVEVIFLILPVTLTITIPAGVLVGILIGLSRMAAEVAKLSKGSRGGEGTAGTRNPAQGMALRRRPVSRPSETRSGWIAVVATSPYS